MTASAALTSQYVAIGVLIVTAVCVALVARANVRDKRLFHARVREGERVVGQLIVLARDQADALELVLATGTNGWRRATATFDITEVTHSVVALDPAHDALPWNR
jgi:hypothetical protein